MTPSGRCVACRVLWDDFRGFSIRPVRKELCRRSGFRGNAFQNFRVHKTRTLNGPRDMNFYPSAKLLMRDDAMYRSDCTQRDILQLCIGCNQISSP